MLDALDEVAEEQKLRVINELEHFASLYPELRIIVTARFHCGLEVSPLFQVVRLSDLENDEYKSVIGKLMGDDQIVAVQLLNCIEEHQGAVREFLKTPLLVTLLIINYKASQEIPDQLTDFYEQVFKLLLQRHDGTKPGYKRARLCKLNDSQLRKGFETFCALSKMKITSHMTEADAVAIAKHALNACALKEDEHKFITDIIKITCLLVKDGEEVRFIHKSVQEYYTAAFLKSKPDKAAQKLYADLFSEKKYPLWLQEIRFLEEIDPFRYSKYGVIPYLEELFNVKGEEFAKAPSEAAKEMLKKRLDDYRIVLEPQIEIEFEAPVERDLIKEIIFPNFGPFSGEVIGLNFSDVVECVIGSKVPDDRPLRERIIDPKAIAKYNAMVDEICSFLFLQGSKALYEINKAEKELEVLDSLQLS